MKIVICQSSLLQGGAEISAVTMANWLNQHGHEVVLALAADMAEPSLVASLRPEIPRSVVGFLRPGGLLSRIVGYVGGAFKLRSLIRRLRPDVVIVNGDWLNLFCPIVLKGSGPKIVTVDHIVHSFLPLKWILRVLYGIGHRCADVYVAVSAQVAADLESKRITPVHVIPPPISLPEVVRKEVRHESDSYCVVGLGRLVEQKGFDLLIRSFKRALARDPRWRVEIWGEGPERANLQRLIGELELDDRVILRGATHAPFDILRRADIFAFPSRAEGFGRVLIEAMASECAVVVARCPGVPLDLIVDGESGVWCECGDVEALSTALLSLAHDADRRRRLGEPRAARCSGIPQSV